MPKGIIIHAAGGPEVLREQDIVLGEPGPGEVRLRQTAIGVNFHDVYVRSGLYRTLPLPGIPGIEAAGIIEAIGPDVVDFRPGERVAYVNPAYGAYVEARIIEASHLLRLPDDIDDRTAAASLVKGLTAIMLVSRLRPVKAGDICVVHAAAGGAGRLLCQLARASGAHVIGSVGSEQKIEIARASGCHDVVIFDAERFAQDIATLSDGHGADIVFDSIGRDTFQSSLDVLALRGHLVNFGQSSGPVAAFAPAQLAPKSNVLWRPILFHFLTSPAERQDMADELFAAIRSGLIKVEIGNAFPLSEVADAHHYLESRSSTGSVILTL